MRPPQFISLETVLDLHEGGLRRFGGSSGIRDLGLIESAQERLYDAMIGIAEHRLTKADLANVFRELCG